MHNMAKHLYGTIASESRPGRDAQSHRALPTRIAVSIRRKMYGETGAPRVDTADHPRRRRLPAFAPTCSPISAVARRPLRLSPLLSASAGPHRNVPGEPGAQAFAGRWESQASRARSGMRPLGELGAQVQQKVLVGRVKARKQARATGIAAGKSPQIHRSIGIGAKQAST